MEKKLTIADIKRHIKKCNKKGIPYDFLGLVEGKDGTPEVESLFTLNGTTMAGYDWVHGNEKMKALIKEVVR